MTEHRLPCLNKDQKSQSVRVSEISPKNPPTRPSIPNSIWLTMLICKTTKRLRSRSEFAGQTAANQPRCTNAHVPINGASQSTGPPNQRGLPINGASQSTGPPNQRGLPINGASQPTGPPNQRGLNAFRCAPSLASSSTPCTSMSFITCSCLGYGMLRRTFPNMTSEGPRLCPVPSAHSMIVSVRSFSTSLAPNRLSQTTKRLGLNRRLTTKYTHNTTIHAKE